jgi:hypothetical protein
LSLPGIAIACNALRDCVAIAVALPLPLPLSLPSRNTALNAYFGQQQAPQPPQSSTIGFSNMTFPLLSFSRPREAQASRSYNIAVVDCLPLPCNGNGNAHTHCTPIAGHCRALPLRFQLSFIAIVVALLIACGRFCLSRNPMAALLRTLPDNRESCCFAVGNVAQQKIILASLVRLNHEPMRGVCCCTKVKHKKTESGGQCLALID